MKLWIDTEFNEYRGALISLALVAEDGREWYGVRYCDDPGWWVREHVMPHLNQEPERDSELRLRLGHFLAGFDSLHIVSDWPGYHTHWTPPPPIPFGVQVAHTDHPLRHYDRTCPACNPNGLETGGGSDAS